MKILTGHKQRDRWLSALEERRSASNQEARESGEEVIRNVRRDGDRAVAQYIRRFDRISLRPHQIVASPRRVPIKADIERAIDVAITRVQLFHEKQRQPEYSCSEGGAKVLHRVRPLRRVGVYVPGGKAVYLSTLIMCAVPARIAGVAEIVVATPPEAAKQPELQYAAERLGVKQIYRAGGAAAIAAMALGTRTLERVDKIVGPGNRYVAAAKQLLSGEVGIDMIAGPTEIVVIADETARPEWVAADLLAQAEHGEDTSPVCVASSIDVAREVNSALTKQVRGGVKGSTRLSTGHGAIIVIESDAEIISFVNRIGPEHVSVQVKSPTRFADSIENCAAVFLGGYSAVALGDYIIGTNHVLPTMGAARFHSPLGVYDFYKRSNVIACTRESFARVSAHAITLAEFEGLPLHAESIRVRGESASGEES